MKAINLCISLLLGISTLSAQHYRIMVKDGEKHLWQYIDLQGKVINTIPLGKIEPFTADGIAIVRELDSDRDILMMANGDIIKPELAFSAIKGFYSGLSAAKLDGKWGYINAKAELVIPAIYNKATDFDNGSALVQSAAGYLIIDHNGNTIPLGDNVKKAYAFENGRLRFIDQSGKTGFINTKGEIVIEPKFADAGDFKSDLAWARNSDRKVGFIDKSGNWAIQPRFKAVHDMLPSNELALVKQDVSWTYVTHEGELVDIKIDRTPFHENLAIARVDGKFGFYNPKGEWAIKPTFEGVRRMKNGYAGARLNGKWGIIDRAGNWVIQPQYDGIREVERVSLN